MGGRTIPTECEHGVTVDGGDFTESEYCAQCESSDCYNDYWATVTDSISPADSSIVDSRLKHMYYHLHLPETRRLQAVIATVKAETAKLEAKLTALESERDGWRDHANKLAADKIALESAIKAHKASFVDDNLSMCDVDEKLWEVLGVQK